MILTNSSSTSVNHIPTPSHLCICFIKQFGLKTGLKIESYLQEIQSSSRVFESPQKSERHGSPRVQGKLHETSTISSSKKRRKKKQDTSLNPKNKKITPRNLFLKNSRNKSKPAQHLTKKAAKSEFDELSDSLKKSIFFKSSKSLMVPTASSKLMSYYSARLQNSFNWGRGLWLMKVTSYNRGFGIELFDDLDKFCKHLINFQVGYEEQLEDKKQLKQEGEFIPNIRIRAIINIPESKHQIEIASIRLLK